MCKTGDIIEGKVTDFGNTGEGIIKIGAFPVFVPYAIKGETVRAKLNFVKKDYAFGDLIEVLNASESRVKPRCPYYEKCGGCDLQHVDTATQLEIKRKNIENVFLYIEYIPFCYNSIFCINLLTSNDADDRIVIIFILKHHCVNIKYFSIILANCCDRLLI